MELEPLPPDARALLDDEKRVERTPSPEALDRVWRRVGQTTAPALATAAGVATGKLVSMFVLGALGGVGGTLLTQRLLAPPPAPMTAPVAAPAPVVTAEPVVVPPTPAPPKPAPPPPLVRPAPAPKEVPVPVAPDDSSLAAEQAILDVGRAALVQRRGAAALEAVARHRAEHRDGQLAEERDALEVQALAQLGRAAEARERAAAFRRAFPSSIFLPAIDELGAGP